MKNTEINIRDPFVLLHEDKYYLYGTRSATCWGPADGFDCYVSNDMENWDGPIEIFHRPEGFFADAFYFNICLNSIDNCPTETFYNSCFKVLIKLLSSHCCYY